MTYASSIDSTDDVCIKSSDFQSVAPALLLEAPLPAPNSHPWRSTNYKIDLVSLNELKVCCLGLLARVLARVSSNQCPQTTARGAVGASTTLASVSCAAASMHLGKSSPTPSSPNVHGHSHSSLLRPRTYGGESACQHVNTASQCARACSQQRHSCV
jgi:hypothetical protein